MVPDIISSFQKIHPNIKFQLTQASNRQIIEQLKSRKVDLALTSLLHEDKEVNCQPLLTEELFLAVSFDHHLASWNALDLNMVKDEPFISFKNDNVLQTIINDLCKKAGFSPDVVFEGDDIGTVSGLVGAKLGVSLIPELHVLDRSKVKLIRISNPVCKREIGMAWLQDAYLSPVVGRFIQYINCFFKND
nr:LysR substrate-binding domain-containing protein [Bacillus sp. B4EP4a]